jgi:hypothetical protein
MVTSLTVSQLLKVARPPYRRPTTTASTADWIGNRSQRTAAQLVIAISDPPYAQQHLLGVCPGHSVPRGYLAIGHPKRHLGLLLNPAVPERRFGRTPQQITVISHLDFRIGGLDNKAVFLDITYQAERSM